MHISLDTGPRPIDFAALREFPGLTGEAFQHPFDLQATSSLKKVPMLSGAITKFNSSLAERQIGLMLSSSCIRLGRNQGRSIYEKFERAAAILDLPKLPEVYLSSGLQFNAGSYGIETYRIILYAPLVDALTEEELLAAIAHELGHMKCRHELYMTMVYLLRSFGEKFIRSVVPLVGGALNLGLQLAILHWYRMAELSCDRAALLVVQDPHIVASMLSKLAGGSRKVLPEINLEGILQQVARYEDIDAKVDQVMKVTLMLSETHPFPLVRVKEIMAWADSNEYARLMDGTALAAGTTRAVRLGVICTNPKCKAVIGINAVFCPDCSVRQRDPTRVCATCESKVESSATTCSNCGNELVIPTQ